MGPASNGNSDRPSQQGPEEPSRPESSAHRSHHLNPSRHGLNNLGIVLYGVVHQESEFLLSYRVKHFRFKI